MRKKETLFPVCRWLFFDRIASDLTNGDIKKWLPLLKIYSKVSPDSLADSCIKQDVSTGFEDKRICYKKKKKKKSKVASWHDH